jgi:hypothetical protein
MEDRRNIASKSVKKLNIDLEGQNTNATTPISKNLNSPSRKISNSRKTKKKLRFNEKLVEVVYVDSYKEYNADMSMEPPVRKSNIECRCLII